MPSPRIEYAVLPAGEGPGQDRCFTADGLVIVLDGASAYDPSVSPDAGKYVDTLGPALVEQITGSAGVDLRDALAEAISQTAEKLALIPGKGPSSTVSIVRWGGDTVDVLALGDSPVIVEFVDGTQEVVVQHPMTHIAPDLRKRYRERLAAGRGFDDVHRSLLAQLQRAEAPLRNVPGGYWIAETVPSAASAAEASSYDAEAVSRCIAFSDGVIDIQRVISSLDAPDKRVDEVVRAGLEREWLWEENIDPTAKALPRSKVHDDKTVAVIYV